MQSGYMSLKRMISGECFVAGLAEHSVVSFSHLPFFEAFHSCVLILIDEIERNFPLCSGPDRWGGGGGNRREVMGRWSKDDLGGIYLRARGQSIRRQHGSFHSSGERFLESPVHLQAQLKRAHSLCL